MHTSPSRNRFKPQPVQAATGSSRNRFKPQPVQAATGSSRNRWLDTLLSVAAVGAAGVALVSFRAPVLSPFLYAPHGVHHFAAVASGNIVRHTFTVRNLHPYPVTVTGLHGSCGCVQTFTGKKSVPFRLSPLEAVSVNVQLDTDRKHGFVTQTVHVTTNENPVGTPLTIEGDVTASSSPKG